jgi:hypothetical protein
MKKKNLQKVHLSLLEFSLKDGMQVDLKSECFTPESRPNKDYTRECVSPGRDCFTKWHSTEDARVRALVNENGRNKDH